MRNKKKSVKKVLALLEQTLEKHNLPKFNTQRLNIEDYFDMEIGMSTKTYEQFLVGFQAYKEYRKKKEALVMSIVRRSMCDRWLNRAELKEVITYNMVASLLSDDGDDESYGEGCDNED